ncbi:M67 family metallopeptidase [Spectribacter hydrogenoxidans]|uniref:M67 family metallopeptidase n=1 Tax=Spectribacter hydrogenoxidans TaxID=3075608 RepID=A0ABU3C1C3_9GAMM|nr:M67 family metallopeptidase [Salinisphaera sp. W335]MDT0635350.1 M67 family metallopeptidase [Salinisphaera sp. W335]
MNELLIPRPLATRLLFEAQKTPDIEVCGLVGGIDGSPVSVNPVPNVADDPTRRFLMDSQAQVDAMRRMRERGESLLAVYHSHPATPPEPSARDLDELGYPDALLLIISLNIKGVLEMRGWQRTDGGVREIDLKVMD